MLHDSSEALPMGTTRVLTFGYDRMLMGLRSRVLRMAGYQVDETFTMTEASESAQSDRIDAVVICHTVPNEEREKLIGAVRQTRKLIPILCVRSRLYDTVPGSCVSVENSPVTLLDSMREAIQVYKSPKANRILLAS